MSSFGLALESAWPYAAAVLVVLGAVAMGALIVVLIRLAKVLKKTETTMDEANELVAKSNKELQPALERVDPMLEKATLSIDTLNLELLRVDAILEDVETLTDAADKTVTTVEKVTSAPTDAVVGIAERVRGSIGSRRSRGAHSTRKFVYPAAMTEGESGLAKVQDDAEPVAEPEEPVAEQPAEPVAEPAESVESVEAAAESAAAPAAPVPEPQPEGQSEA